MKCRGDSSKLRKKQKIVAEDWWLGQGGSARDGDRE